ncbi:MAG: hypothetical protein ABSG43_15800 [Solirubrobacteraceae bacterium]
MRAVDHTNMGGFMRFKLVSILASGVLLLLAAVGVALAAKPKAGYTYSTPSIVAVNNKKLGTETVTGKFVSATKVTGKVTTHANLGQYKGVTKSYTATLMPSTT